MLASPDLGLTKRQPLLPGLATALDAEALAGAAASYGLTLPADAAVSYVRFKPSTACIVAYASARDSRHLRYYATAFRRDSAKLVKAYQRKVVHTAEGPGRVVMGEHAIELCVFPNDDHIPVLIRLADAKTRQRLLLRIKPLKTRAIETAVTVLAYKPERRCVLVLTPVEKRPVVIRAYEARGFGPALARAMHFSDSGAAGIQRLIGCDMHHRLLAMDWCEGVSLAAGLRDGLSSRTRLTSAGGELASLHAQDPAALPEWRADDAIKRLKQTVKALGSLCPDLAPRAAALGRDLARVVETVEPARATIHGDFDASQVLINETAATIIDLDECSSGPPAIDIGNFVAKLKVSAARSEIAESDAREAIDGLIGGYESRAPLPPAKDLRTATAMALFAMALEPFRRHRTAWPQEIEVILEMAERHLRGDE
ncbi:MAG: phosphotransferase [Gemmatimonadaceae bacterium]